MRAWALAAVGSGDHPRPDGAGGKSAPRRPGKGGRSRSSQVLGLSAANAPPSRSLSSCPAHVARVKCGAEGWTRQREDREEPVRSRGTGREMKTPPQQNAGPWNEQERREARRVEAAWLCPS